MKIQPDRLEGVNTIQRHEPGQLWVNATCHDHSVLVPWQGDVLPWPPTHLQDIVAAHFDQILQLKPELVIFGSGQRLRFVSPALYRGLIDAGIGIETMDTAAACRTYNVLATEGRSVVAALILEATATSGA